jgi:hypothetical protein
MQHQPVPLQPDHDEATALLVAHLKAIPLWEKTAPLHAIAAALAGQDESEPDAVRQAIERIRQCVDSLLADDPLQKLHSVIVRLESELRG